MNVLVLGATGMLGSTAFNVLSADSGLKVYGTVRNSASLAHFPSVLSPNIIVGIDVEQQDSLVRAIAISQPKVIVNCVGLVKQLSTADNPLFALPLNSLLPHRLAGLCDVIGGRLIHISTDCVFSGSKGNYLETDSPDASDLYGRSKLIGEVVAKNAITLRTSIIGHELNSAKSLLNWFLAQKGTVKGFTKAVFSGLPTVELSKIIRDVVIPNPNLYGLYHVASDPINKFDLLNLVAERYGKKVQIQPSDELVIDRSLNAEKFLRATNYKSPAWPELVKAMFEYQSSLGQV
jgi:dTDP-4-dehydrorhamnose reductase